MGQVQVDPEEVEGIARLTRQVSREIAGGNALKATDLSLASFGNYEEAQGLVSVHGTAHEVVRATLNGVQQDLENFAAGITNAVQDLYDRDVTTQAILAGAAGLNPLMLATGGDVYNDLDADTLENLGGVTATSHGDEARNDAVNSVNEGGDA